MRDSFLTDSFLTYGTAEHLGFEDCTQETIYQQGGWFVDEAPFGRPQPSFPHPEWPGTQEHGARSIPRPRAPVDDSVRADVRVEASARHPPAPHRRRRSPAAMWPQLLGLLIGVLTALTVTTVCMLGWLFSYGPLQDLARPRVPSGLSQLWPVIVYGPWLAGSLSVLRAALEGCRITHSWVVVIVFSGVATALCVTHATPTVPNLIIAGLPPITVLVSLHQLVRQIIATRRTPRGPAHKAGR